MKKWDFCLVLFLSWNTVDALIHTNLDYEFCVEDALHPLELSFNSSNWNGYSLIPEQHVLTSKHLNFDSIFAHHATYLQKTPVSFRITEKQGRDRTSSNNEVQTDKSPVSTLYELCAKHSTDLSFQVQAEGPAHKKMFTSTCTVGELMTHGQGNSKSAAKHNAAREMLRLLEGLSDTVTPRKKTKKQKPIKHSPETDPIPYLQEWSKQRIQYVEGDHTRELFHMKCLLDDLQATGEGRSKKIAKRMAALEMIKTLNENGKLDMNNIPLESHSSDPKAMESDKTENAEEGKNYNYGETTTHESSEIKDTDTNKKDVNSDRDIPTNADETQPQDNMQDLLRSVGKEMGYEINYRDTTSGQTHISFVSISSGTAVTCYGVGSNKEKSRQQASHAAIQYLNAIYINWGEVTNDSGSRKHFISEDSNGHYYVETQLK